MNLEQTIINDDTLEIHEIVKIFCTETPENVYSPENLVLAHIASACYLAQQQGIERYAFMDAVLTLYDEIE